VAKIILFCSDVLGNLMAGPAIRYWEFAKALSKKHEVTLLTQQATEAKLPGVAIACINDVLWVELVKQADVLIAQSIPAIIALRAKQYGTKIILDAYDPMPLENLEIFKNDDMVKRNKNNHEIVSLFNFSFAVADAVICANERQKNLWVGLLLSLRKITPNVYDQDISLKQMIDIVPFGLPSHPPLKNGEGLRHRFGIKDTDKVLLWGGGIWNWFDPLTLIRAVKILSTKRSDIKLVFMGIKHPNECIPEMKMAVDAINLAKKLHLLDKHVFINYGWTPYEDRQNFLLEADIGVSNHFNHLETGYAFRTRILDYIWAGLPIVATEGDSFADLIKSHELGCVVPYEDAEALAMAFESILNNPERQRTIKTNLRQLSISFQWENVVKPIENIIESFTKYPPKSLSISDVKLIARHVWQDKGPLKMVKLVAKFIVKKFAPKKVFKNSIISKQ